MSKKKEEKVVQEKNPNDVIQYVISRLGKPKNLYKIDAKNYHWDGLDNRWRVTILVEERFLTGNGIETSKIRRTDSFFLHFDDVKKEATYCNPQIERKY